MRAVLDVDACDLAPTSPPGYYKCRTIDAAARRRLRAGCTAAARAIPRTWCLIDPLPSALTGVTFTGGDELAGHGPLDAARRPCPPGRRCEIRVWRSGELRGAAGVGRRPRDRHRQPPTWQDARRVETTGTHCFRRLQRSVQHGTVAGRGA